MRILLLLFLFALPGVAPAQRAPLPPATGHVQLGHVPDNVIPPGASSDRKPDLCANSNGTLLDVLRELTSDASVGNELKFEKEKQLNDKQIYDRRMEIIKMTIKTLRGQTVRR